MVKAYFSLFQREGFFLTTRLLVVNQKYVYEIDMIGI